MLQPEWSQKTQTNHSCIRYQCQSHNQDPRPVAHKQKLLVTLVLCHHTGLQIYIFFLLKGQSLFWANKTKIIMVGHTQKQNM